MNTIEALRIIQAFLRPLFLDEEYSEKQAAKALDDLLAAYDALVPPLDLWPSDAQWITIDANGNAEWHTAEPSVDCETWYSTTGEEAGNYQLEPGIDWRLCKWQRPEVTDD